eukprot:GSChrysophyteH1.ASY1.ANO1.514.1 assembled CDS
MLRAFANAPVRGFASLAVQNLKLGSAAAIAAPSASQISISMVASPINPSDRKGGAGVGGSVGVGKVTAVGAGVKDLKEGDWVVPQIGFGAWCSEAVVEAASVTPVANDIPAAYAATMSTDAATAYRLLRDFGVSAGDWIIQSDATSPVGLAVVQMARDMGIKTINIIDSETPDGDKALKLLTNLGGDLNCTDLFVHSAEMNDILSGQSVKLALCGVSGEVNTYMARMLAKGSSMVTYSSSVNAKEFNIPAECDVSGKSFDIASWYASAKTMDKATMFADIAAAVRENQLTGFYQEHDFDDFDWALKQSTEPFALRQVVLRMDHPDRMAEHDALEAEAYSVFETDYR